MTIHELLDYHYGVDGDRVLAAMLAGDIDLEARAGDWKETPLHVATRRRRLHAIEMLLHRGANVDATTAGGKTAFAHAVRRGFTEISDLLAGRGASTDLTVADRLAVALVSGAYDEAASILSTSPECVRTGNPEDDRLLADVAGRNASEPVVMLIDAGADLTVPGLDSGTPLHQAAWFGQPENARLLVEAGAPLEVFDAVHGSSPLGWAVHGSRYSGGAADRQDAYVAVVRMLLDSGARLQYPGDPEGDSYRQRLLQDATQQVAEVLRHFA